MTHRMPVFIREWLTPALVPLLLGLLAPGASALAARSDSLTTVAERSGFQRTGRYEEVGQLCHAFQAAFARISRRQGAR